MEKSGVTLAKAGVGEQISRVERSLRCLPRKHLYYGGQRERGVRSLLEYASNAVYCHLPYPKLRTFGPYLFFTSFVILSVTESRRLYFRNMTAFCSFFLSHCYCFCSDMTAISGLGSCALPLTAVKWPVWIWSPLILFLPIM